MNHETVFFNICPYRKWVQLTAALLLIGCGGPSNQTAKTTSGTATNTVDTGDAPTASPTPGASSNQMSGGYGAYPQIVIDNGQSGAKKVTAKFEFEGQSLSFSLRVSKALLEGARNANKYAVAEEGKGDKDWRERYNMAFITDDAQKPFLDELHAALMKLAKQLKLDDNRTLELLTAFVQYIEYDEQDDAVARFPIETFADQEGDCDDKSRLLVSLLTRSGYRVATLNFNDENHMAVGVKASAMDYKGTGYAYIETTSPSMVGFPFSEKANVQLNTIPVVQPVGNGKKKYTAAKQIAFLVKTKAKLEEEIQKEQTEIDRIVKQAKDAEETVRKRESELNAAKGTSNQNHAVKKYNDAVDKYNAVIDRQKKAARNVNQKIEIRNYIATHATDRHHTYQWVKKQLEKK